MLPKGQIHTLIHTLEDSLTMRSRARGWWLGPALLLAVGSACGDASSASSGGGGGVGGGATQTTTNATTGVGNASTNASSGTTGVGGQGTSGTGGGAGQLCPSHAFFCDDFEQGTLGAAPPGMWDPNSQGIVTGDHAHSGTRAVRLDEGFNFQSLPLVGASDVLFARVMMWSAFQGDTADSRYSIMSVETDAGHQAAIDSNGHLLVIHHYPNGESGIDSTLSVPTGQWTCIETSYDRTTRTFRSWVDGAEAVELAAPASTEVIPDAWTLFQLSGVVYHGGTTTQYYDDVALSTQRIGCP